MSHLLRIAGIKDPGFATVFPGWNVWAVWQVKDLSNTNPLWWGVSRETRLRIWVEDNVRLKAGGAIVADKIDLKGSQVQILGGPPTGLTVFERKDVVPGLKMLNGPAELYYLRFYNRGAPSELPWPSDGEYMLESVFKPSANAPATSGAPPPRIVDSAGVTDAMKVAQPLLVVGGLALAAVYLLPLLAAKKAAGRS